MHLSIAFDFTVSVFVRRTIATVAATAGSLALTVPLSPVLATEIPVSQLDYESCAGDLLNSGLDALRNCRQVRRPLELATCVVNIHSMTKEPAIGEVLDGCRRSLLPERFANCVVGISNPINAPKFNIPPSEAMNACIDAPDRIEDTFPTYIPQDDSFDDRPNLQSRDR
jgi:hypothetical protein